MTRIQGSRAEHVDVRHLFSLTETQLLPAMQPVCPCLTVKGKLHQGYRGERGQVEGWGLKTGPRPRVGRNALTWWSKRGEAVQERGVNNHALNNKHDGFRAEMQASNVTNQKTKTALKGCLFSVCIFSVNTEMFNFKQYYHINLSHNKINYCDYRYFAIC